MVTAPRLICPVLDAPDVTVLAEFYARLLRLTLLWDEGPGGPGDPGWVDLVNDVGHRVIAVQHKPDLVRSTWPAETVPMQEHLDFALPTRADLDAAYARAVELGARLLADHTAERVPLYVLADPAGHPFCLIVTDVG